MAEAKDDHPEAEKPVIDVVTTVFESSHRRMAHARPVCYGSEGEVFSSDEDDYDTVTRKVMKTEIFVHSKHLSKWLEKDPLTSQAR